jgi:hypothetical protein
MIEYIIVGGISFWVGWKAREYYALRQVFKMLQSETVKQNDETPKTVLKLEKHSNSIFAYDRETNEFLGQGDSLDSLSVVLKERFPGISFAVTKENLKELELNDESV